MEKIIFFNKNIHN